MTLGLPISIRSVSVVAALSLALGPTSSMAQPSYAQVIGNDMRPCDQGRGPAVRLQIEGLRSSSGNLFVRTYLAQRSDWFKAKRYLTRIDAASRRGSMSVCVPLPSTGQFAIAVQHDENGNHETDLSTDGAGMSNNPRIRFVLGIPLPPGVDKVAFAAGSGVTNLTVGMRYRE